MENLSDNTLMESFVEAKHLQLDPRFITLLEQELQNRSIPFHDMKTKD